MGEEPVRLRPALCAAGVGVLMACALLPGAVAAQQPPDSVPPPADSLVADSIATDTVIGLADTLAADTLQDSVVVLNLPTPRSVGPVGAGSGVWEWDREALLRARGLTLLELLASLPGITPLRGGDYGMPRTVAPLGFAAGSVRLRIDGVEWEPLTGTVPDLAIINVSGLSKLRVRRTGTGVTVDLSTLRYEVAEPISVIEVGTGDLDTNLFGATFALPNALGGAVAVGLDRIDTQGRDRDEPSSRFGGWARYTWVANERTGIEVDYRTRSVDRGTVFEPAVLKRARWAVQGRWRPDDRILTSAFYSSTSQSTEISDTTFSGPGVSQYGASVHAADTFFSGTGTVRFFDGAGQLDRALELEVTADHPELGGASAQWDGAWWSGASSTNVSAQAWSAPRAGVSVFGGIDRGAAPLRRPPAFTGPPTPVEVQIPLAPPPDTTVTATPLTAVDKSALRLGGRFTWRDVEVGGAWLRVEADSALATGLPMDPSTQSQPTPPSRSGIEAWVRVPIPILDGLALEGWAVRWDSVAGPDPYRPRMSYDARVAFHNIFLPTENLEVFVDVGARGRDAMDVLVAEDPLADPPDLVSRVPFYQDWYARLQIRIVSLHIFANWENFTIRDRNQDFPDRLLPSTRATYGVRWILRN